MMFLQLLVIFAYVYLLVPNLLNLPPSHPTPSTLFPPNLALLPVKESSSWA